MGSEMCIRDSLINMDNKENLHRSLIMLPFAPASIEGFWDVHAVLAALAKEATNAFILTPRGKELASNDAKLEYFMGRHKKKEIELGGHRYVVMASGSDRPYFGLSYERAGGKKTELLHLYQAMGLTEDHALQTTCLARVLDHELAHEVIKAAQQMLGHARVVVSATPQDEDARNDLLSSWSEKCFDPMITECRATQVHGMTFPSCPDFEGYRSFLKTFYQDSNSLAAVVDTVADRIAQLHANTAVQDMLAPHVDYQYEANNCKMPPAEIQLPGHFPGRLFVGGLSPALSTAWLQYHNVKLCVNCIGKFKGNEVHPLYTLVKEARRRDEIPCHTFAVNNSTHQRSFYYVFNAMKTVLESPNNSVYVHCRIGSNYG